MKRYLISLINLLAMFNICVAADDWAQFEKYQDANQEIGDNTPAVVFMGNSITEGWVKLDPSFFADNNFAGRGISGQTSYQMLLRFREDVINLHPKMVVINGGTNDVAENNHEFKEERTLGNIISMVELAQASGIRPVLTSLLPAVYFPWHPHIEKASEKIISLNKRIEAYANEKGLLFVNYYPSLAIEDGALNPEYSEDGVHPNLKGYKVMESIILPFLTEP